MTYLFLVIYMSICFTAAGNPFGSSGNPPGILRESSGNPPGIHRESFWILRESFWILRESFWILRESTGNPFGSTGNPPAILRESTCNPPGIHLQSFFFALYERKNLSQKFCEKVLTYITRLWYTELVERQRKKKVLTT